MHNLVYVLGLGPLLERHRVEHRGMNFEAVYSALTSDDRNHTLLAEIEGTAASYFSSLRLPDRPTLYDHLVLFLRPKDFIATFNWDPFLVQAVQRNYIDRGLIPPRFACLHGCVATTYCDRHKPLTFGNKGHCGRCGQATTPTRLLFPMLEKDYGADPHTAASWQDVQRTMKHAYIFTVFGYGAPATDSKAIELLKGAWGNVDRRSLNQVELVDIRDEEELEEQWSPFIHSHHYHVCTSFYQSLIARHPRRSCDSFWNATMDCECDVERNIPVDLDFPALWNWFQPLLDQEVEYESSVRGVQAAPHSNT